MSALRRGLVAELPYYRADPARWAATIDALRRDGVATVSAYVPWRHHELAPGTFDLHGRTRPDRDLVRFARLVTGAGLGFLAKPGPFVHAELPFGGLPDRFGAPPHAPVQWADGSATPTGYLGRPFPSPHDPAFRRAATGWAAAVHAAIGSLPGLVVQVGNEGALGERAGDLATVDVSPPARAARTGQLDPDGVAAIADAALAGTFDAWDGVPRTANVRPPAWRVGPATGSVPDAWVLRNRHRSAAGHTDWVGDVARDDDALASQLLAALWLGGPNLERNWGLDLAGGRLDVGSARYASLVDLAAGVATHCLYPAVATDAWGPELDVDPATAAAHGEDPDAFARPYGPSAPWTDGGEPGRPDAHAAAVALGAFLARLPAWWGPDSIVATATCAVDPSDSLAAARAGADPGALAAGIGARFGTAVAAMAARPGHVVVPVPTGHQQPLGPPPPATTADGPCLMVHHRGPEGGAGLVALSRSDHPVRVTTEVAGRPLRATLGPRGAVAISVDHDRVGVLWHHGVEARPVGRPFALGGERWTLTGPPPAGPRAVEAAPTEQQEVGARG